jgi:hypothetical protein
VKNTRAIVTVFRDRKAVIRSLELSFEMMVRGGITIRTPDTDAALIATNVQLDGDILVELSPQLSLLSPDARDVMAARHASAVSASLMPLVRLPEVVQALYTVLAALAAGANLAALAASWGSWWMLGPLGTSLASVAARRPLQAGFRWLLQHLLRQSVGRILMELQTASEAEYRKRAV